MRTRSMAAMVAALSWCAFCLPRGEAQDLSRWSANLKGSWTGQLEYRDYQTDKRVALPTWLEVSAAEDGRSLKLTYIYDDGPNKIVRESSLFALDIGQKTATITSLRDGIAQTKEVFRAEGLEMLLPNGRGVFTLNGSATENGHEVEVHITVTCVRNLYKFEKETRVAGEPFRFRDSYTMTRRDPPRP